MNASLSGEIHAGSEKALHVLTLTPFYPTVDDDASGCFVAEPLTATTHYGVQNSVLAVSPRYRPGGVLHPQLPHAESVGGGVFPQPEPFFFRPFSSAFGSFTPRRPSTWCTRTLLFRAGT